MGNQKKWNNQGGSGWGDKPKKPKKDLPNIPQFDELPESNTVSFRLSKPRRNIPNYRELGDEIWTDWEPFDDYELPEVDNDDLDMPEIRDDIRDIPNTLPPTIPPDLVPVAAYKEYEIVVKYKSQAGQLVLTISSGQAYAARYQINDPKLDFAIAVASSEPISIGSYVGLTNLIQLNSPLQDPAFSLYKWVRSVLDIATDNDGNSGDPILDNLPTNDAISLPSTSFSWQNQQFDLFYGSGIKPTQLCLHCVDDVVKFRPNQPVNAAYLWTVTITGDPMPLCKSLADLPVVYISIAPGYPTEIDPNNNPNGDIFGLRISTDEPIAVDLPVWFGIGGTADPLYWYFLSGYGADENNIPAFIIPANNQYIDVLIRPTPNPGQTDPTNIIVDLIPNPDLYEIGFSSQTVDLVPVILPVVTVSVAPGSPSEIDPNNAGGQIFTFRISIDAAQNDDLFVRFQYPYLGTADYTTDYVSPTTTFTIDGFTCYKIAAGNTFVDIPVYPNPQPSIASSETIILKVLQNSSEYRCLIDSQVVILTKTEVAIEISLTVVGQNKFKIISSLPMIGAVGLQLYAVRTNEISNTSNRLSLVQFDATSNTDLRYMPFNVPIENIFQASYGLRPGFTESWDITFYINPLFTVPGTNPSGFVTLYAAFYYPDYENSFFNGSSFPIGSTTTPDCPVKITTPDFILNYTP